MNVSSECEAVLALPVVAQFRRWAKMKQIFTTAAITTLLSVCVLRLMAAGVDPAPRRDLYDYSSAQTSFQSFQKAIRGADLEGAVIHFWYMAKATASSTSFDTNTTFSATAERFRSHKGSPFPQLDTAGLSGKLKLTDAVFLKEVSVEHQDAFGGYSICRFLVEWPAVRKRAYLHACKFDGASEWWFWPAWGCGDNIRTFDSGSKEKD